MRRKMKRLLAIICSIAVAISGLSVANWGKTAVDAAAPSGTISLDLASVNHIAGWNLGSYVNVPFTGIPADYKQGPHFMSLEFADENMIFNGGMTYDDFVDGLTIAYVANSTTLQFNWGNRTEPFTPGWSFSLKEGALLPYLNTADETKYVELDKEYVFTFTEGNSDYTNLVKLASYKTATFGLEVNTFFGNGTVGVTNLFFKNDTIANANVKYCYMHTDASYSEYIDMNGVPFNELEGKGVQVRYILDGGTKCLQIENWGSLRTTMTKGSQFVFKEGMPIYYITSNGDEYKATLDATYIFECMGSNSDNTQTFYGVCTNDASKFGIETKNYGATENYINLALSPNTAMSDFYIEEDLLQEACATDYIDLSGCSSDLDLLGVKFKFIPTPTPVIQLAFGDAGKAALKAGDTITFKKGMPVVWQTNEASNQAKVAVLQEEYLLTVLSNDGGQLDVSCVLSGTYELDTHFGGPVEEGSNKYGQAAIVGKPFEDAQGTFEGEIANKEFVIDNYFEVSGKTAEELKADGWFFRQYNVSALVGVRFYCPTSAFDLEADDYVIFKKGFPVTYTTADGATKTTVLARDYGYRYNGTSFVYDSTLQSTEEEPGGGSDDDDDDDEEVLTGTYTIQNVFYHNEAYMDVRFDNMACFSNAVEFERTVLDMSILKDYIEVQGNTYEDLVNKGYNLEAFYIPALRGIRINFTTFDLQAGDIILIKEGLPISFTTKKGNTKTVTLDKTYGYVKNAETAFVYTEGLTEIPEPREESFGLVERADSFLETSTNSTRINLPFKEGPLEGTLYVSKDILADPTTTDYVKVDGYTNQQLIEAGMQVLFIPTAGVFQVVQGSMPFSDLTTISFKKGMEISYFDNGPVLATLDDDYTYQVIETENGYAISRIKECEVKITVDGEVKVDTKYLTGTVLDLSKYENKSKGKVMSIHVNGVAIQEEKYTVQDHSDIVIRNRADLCVVVFMDGDVTVAVCEYVIGAKKVQLPYTPDKDGYNDTWEKFTLENGVVKVNAVHTQKQTHPVVKLKGVVLEETEAEPNNKQDSSTPTSPATGDGANPIGWLLMSVMAMAVVILGITDRKKRGEI